MEHKQIRRGLRVVSVFEAAKGLIVLLIGFGLLKYIHEDFYLTAVKLVHLFHLNPSSRFPMVFLDLANHITDRQIWLMALSALLYATARFVEAYGLFHERRWAQWFGLLAGGLYIPFELIELARGVTWLKALLLIVNMSVVGYLSFILYDAGQKRQDVFNNAE